MTLWGENNPQANPEAVVTSGKARFTVLTPEMIRIEYSDKGFFEDRATFTVVNRNLAVPHYSKSEDATFIYIETDKLKLKYRKGTNPRTLPPSSSNLSITLNHNGREVLWYPGKPDPLNLKGTCRTLDGSNGQNKRSEMEDGLISRSGWAVIEDSWTSSRSDGSRSFAFEPETELGYDWWAERKDPHALDIYFLGYGSNYKKALSDYTHIAGKIPLPPSYVFGYWYSKYSSYSADDYREIMNDLSSNNIPTDVMILDMDWHWNGSEGSMSGGRGGWTGWSWNTNLIPDPKGLLKEMHDRNFKVALNLHPADGVSSQESPEFFTAMNEFLRGKYDVNGSGGKVIPWYLDYPDFTDSFFSTIIREHEGEGVDFWWLDWQQHLTSPYTDGLGETFWCNHVFFNDMKKNRPDRRPMIFHRWGGLGSHRYQIGFSGDTFINYASLAFQPYFTATASNVCYGYWGHDIGGHMYDSSYPVNDPELLLRWFQFGVFTPIFRSHAAIGTWINRQIWTYDNFPQLNATVKLRYALFPYIYTMARKSYDSGVGICRPMYYDYPEQDEAYTFESQYFFGDDILVAPVVEPSSAGVSKKRIWFPEGNWWSVADNRMIEGNSIQTLDFTLDQIPYFYREGAIIVNNPAEVKSTTERPEKMIVNIVAGKDGETTLYEDSGDSNDYDSNFANTRFFQKTVGSKAIYTIGAREGTADRLPSKRGYQLRIYNTAAPAGGKAKVDGKNVKTVYDSAARCTIVDVPLAKCDKQREITIEY